MKKVLDYISYINKLQEYHLIKNIEYESLTRRLKILDRILSI
jgi:hypothetical protein